MLFLDVDQVNVVVGVALNNVINSTGCPCPKVPVIFTVENTSKERKPNSAWPQKSDRPIEMWCTMALQPYCGAFLYGTGWSFLLFSSSNYSVNKSSKQLMAPHACYVINTFLRLTVART